MVEWKTLGEVCEIGTGSNNREDYCENGLYPFFVRSKDVLRINSYLFDEEAILIPGEGGIGEIFHYINGKYGLHQRAYRVHPINDGIKGKYIYYFLFEYFKSYIDKKSYKSTATSIRKPMLQDFPIAIPSKPEQERIVKILDTFTDSIANLKAQIDARRKQYEYYRNQLLDLEGKEGVEMKAISQVATNYTGLTYKPDNVSKTGVLVLRSSNINEDTFSFSDNVFVQMDIPPRAIVKENDILICVRNGSKKLVGKAAMITKDAEGMAFGAFMTILRASLINSKYLFYIWQSSKVKKQYKGDDAMPIAQITSKDFQKIIIPIPSKEEQSRIVGILDQFEAIIANLEAQLKAREKQYEYYRNKLLTFE